MPMLIPFEELSESTLMGIVKSFVLQEGTDYGDHEYSLDQKIEHVLGQLKKGLVYVAFDEKSGTATIITQSQAREML